VNTAMQKISAINGEPAMNNLNPVFDDLFTSLGTALAPDPAMPDIENLCRLIGECEKVDVKSKVAQTAIFEAIDILKAAVRAL